MSTNDVPGAVAENRDALAMGCWAEHDDGSLIFVESTEGDRAIYSIFDTSTEPITEYRDSMGLADFQKRFSWDSRESDSIRWTWHDKTPFPWNRVIKGGAKDGLRYASAGEQLTAAARVAKSRKILGAAVEPKRYGHRTEKVAAKKTIRSRIQAAFRGLRDG